MTQTPAAKYQKAEGDRQRFIITGSSGRESFRVVPTRTLTCPLSLLLDTQRDETSWDAPFLLAEDRGEDAAIQVSARRRFPARTTAQEQRSRERERRKSRKERGEEVKTVDGCCPDRGDSAFFTDEEKKDFKIESKDRNSPSGGS